MAAAYFNEDTIIAIASAPNAVGAVGIVRVSGPRVAELIPLLLSSPKGKINSSKLKSHYFYRCHVVASDGALIDDAMYVWMKGPRSFTGEDVLEIQLHGNPFLMRNVVKAALATGLVRMAEPGEFSFRAFKNGKMDLSQAEAVMDLISSKSAKSAETALQTLLGNTKNFITARKAELVHYLAEVEVDIDFSDQGLSVIDYEKWSEKLGRWNERVESVRERFQRMRPLREGVRVALVGMPNSGKSTLFNTLLGEDRSIVSDVAGTTRDVVRESFYLGGVLCLLSDTAGIRRTQDQIEAEGIERSFGEISQAHLVLLVVDLTSDKDIVTSIKEQVADLTKKNSTAKQVVILNKMDALTPSQLEKLRSQLENLAYPHVFLSAKTGSGLPGLEDLVISLFQSAGAAAEGAEESFDIGRTRHYELLGKAVEFVAEARGKVARGEKLPDLLSSDLRAALDALGEITGEVSADDVLNYIFAEFCIGK